MDKLVSTLIWVALPPPPLHMHTLWRVSDFTVCDTCHLSVNIFLTFFNLIQFDFKEGNYNVLPLFLIYNTNAAKQTDK